MKIPEDIFGYLEDYADGVLSQDGYDAIVAWFYASDENAQQFAEWFVWQAQLRDSERLANMQEVFSREGLLDSVGQGPHTGLNRRRSSLHKANNPRYWAISAIVACLLLIATGVAWYARTSSNPGDVQIAAAPAQAEAQAPRAEEDSVVAYVGRLTNCVWQANERNEGDQLAVGSQVQLDSGRAELVFGQGARVSLRGPCRLQIEDENTFRLNFGDVSVEASFGFKVITPSGVVIDLGTAFGVSVDDAGDSEVHVFEGEVAFQPTGPGDMQKKSIVLSKDQACRYSVAGVTLDQFQANEAKFAWRRRDVLSANEVPALPIRNNLVLWLAADRFVETDDQQRVECWRDLLVDTNNYPEDALQPAAEYRPYLTQKGINGHPSVRFGGNGNFLLTPPLYTTDEQTAFVVCTLNAAEPHFQQVLNYNGPPQRITGPQGGTINPAVFQIFLDNNNDDGRFNVKGHLFSGFTDNRQQSIVSEAIASDRVNLMQPVVICFRHSHKEGRMTLFVDGDKAASESSEHHIAITSRKIIGRHPIFNNQDGIFHGDVGELLIFNRALPDEEVAQVSDYLMQRFDLGSPE
ncbi:FecR domain-containing protein [Aeoliella sp. ICT_H6.2]|uniref:FecR domain-containing protein n=1 Tax=Aeoliella straminimaris TaxID=2954799 RepID=A0A9X2JJD3_9BACT|nr:LamG-like jellyroll fold domain-containing protein [Aeoliella straminimaris]MCO6046618.1 FecR domain-containing protein [Aeoliella straminimaris]